MQNITSVAELKNVIQLLEVEHAAQGRLLKEQFFHTYESLKPVNLLISALNTLTSSPYLIENILSTSIGLASGYFTKKIVIGSSVNMFRKLIGSILKFGVINIIIQNPDTIKSFGQYIFHHIFHKKESIPSEHSE